MGYLWRKAKTAVLSSPESGNLTFLKAIESTKESLFPTPGTAATATRRASGLLDIAALPGLADEVLGERPFYAASNDDVRYDILRSGSMTACVITFPKACRTFLTFDYSTPGEDWKVNFDAHNARHPGGGRVHEGYMQEMFSQHASGKTMYDAVNATLAGHAAAIHEKGGKPHLSVTGYSKGGAQALLFSSLATNDNKLRDAGIELDELKTFGQPAIGNERFAEVTSERFREQGIDYTRYVNDRDIVPKSIFYNSHFGRHVFLSYDGFAFEDPSSDFVRYKRLFERRSEDSLKEQVEDHFMESYRSMFATASGNTYVDSAAMDALDARASYNLQNVLAWIKSQPLRPEPPEMPVLATAAPLQNIPNLQSPESPQIS